MPSENRPARSLPGATLAFLLLPACSISRDAEFAGQLELVRQQDLMRHVEALCRIGPRPAGYPAQTEQTLAYLEGELQSWGYETRRVPFGAYVMHYKRRKNADGTTSIVGMAKTGVQHNLVAESGLGVAEAQLQHPVGCAEPVVLQGQLSQ